MRRVISASTVAVATLTLLLEVASTPLWAQWLDSLPAVAFESNRTPQAGFLEASVPPAIPDTIIPPADNRLKWAIVGAVLGGASAWCAWDAFARAVATRGVPRSRFQAPQLARSSAWCSGNGCSGRYFRPRYRTLKGLHHERRAILVAIAARVSAVF